MAVGDVVFFDQFLLDRDKGLHDLSSDVIKVGFTIGTTAPAVATADPRWGAGGTTDFSTEEVAPGGNYSSGGPIITSTTVTLVGGKSVFDGADISITKDAANPTNSRWGIIYNSTDTGKRAIGYVDYGSSINMTIGNFSITWNASGIGSTDQV